MSQYKQLAKKSGLYFIGNFSSKLVNVALIPLYAFFLSADELGIYDYFVTIMSAISPFLFLAIWEAILRYILLKEGDDKKKVIGTSVITVSSLIIVLICFILGVITIAPAYSEYILLIGIMTISDSMCKIWQYYARALGYNKDYVKSSIISTLLNFLLNFVLLCFFSLGYYALFLAYTISQFSVTFILERKIKIFNYLKFQYWDYHLLKDMLHFSLPLILNLSSAWLISGYGRTVVVNKLGPFYSGMYAFSNKFGTIVLTLGSVFSAALIEEAIIKSKKGSFALYFSNVLNTIIEIYLVILILMIPFIGVFYRMINETEYINSLLLVPFFLFFAMLSTLSTSVGAVYQAINKTRLQAITTIIGGGFTVIFIQLFIHNLGILGVVISQIIGAGTMLLLRLYGAKKYADITIKNNKIYILMIIYILISLICVQETLIYTLMSFIIVIFIVCILERKYIGSGLKLICEKINKKVI